MRGKRWGGDFRDESKSRGEPRRRNISNLKKNGVEERDKVVTESSMCNEVKEFVRNPIVSTRLARLTSGKNINNLFFRDMWG